MNAPFTPMRLAFLLGVPVAWAVLLLFHPDVDRTDVFASLRPNLTTYQIVHVGMLFFIGLIGVALYLLVRDLPGTAARISRWAIGPFVVLYGAWEAVIGLGAAAFVQHAQNAPARQRSAVADALQGLQDDVIIGDPGVVGLLGTAAWLIAAVAAAFAYRRVRAPALACVLLGFSAIIVSHPPPIGPIGLACFAAAVGLLAFMPWTATTADASLRPPGLGAKV
jgi:hypothetical protein